MVILLFFAFISGLVTILAPCIWPLLPIILSSTATGEKRKPLGITLGIMLSFGIFTLSVSYLVSLFRFDPDILRLLAVVIIGLLGLTLVIPSLTGFLEGTVSRLTSVFGGRLTGQTHGFRGGFITGLALGIVWSPCAGPILATIATLAATRSINIEIIMVTVVYIIGVGIPLFLFAQAGRTFFSKTRFVSAYTSRIQQVFGVIMILTGLAIYTNYDKVIQAKLLDAFPAYSSFLYNLESNESVQKQLKEIKNMKEEMEEDMQESSQTSLKNFGPAPEFVGISKWLNLPAGRQVLTMNELRGKVVLIDIWTYTCINCIRTLPHVTSWYDTYKGQGFIVIAVHTPEFEFEKKTENVLNAIKQYNIAYPVAQDNDYATWNAYNNRYWPAKYLVDAKGNIRYFHFGEGKYEETEQAIQTLLQEKGSQVVETTLPMPDETPRTRFSPETYLGSRRMQYFYPNGGLGNGKQTFTLEKSPPQNSFSLGGEWTITDEAAIATEDASLALTFNANKVFLVIRPGSTKPARVKVFLDGKLVDSAHAGSDVKNGVATIDVDRLYNLIDLGGAAANHTLLLEFEIEGTEAFAFTFG